MTEEGVHHCGLCGVQEGTDHKSGCVLSGVHRYGGTLCPCCNRRSCSCPTGDIKFVGSTEGRWSVDKDYKRQQTIVTLRIPFTEGMGEDERGVRKLISERLNEIGDVLMNLWRKGQVKK